MVVVRVVHPRLHCHLHPIAFKEKGILEKSLMEDRKALMMMVLDYRQMVVS